MRPPLLFSRESASPRSYLWLICQLFSAVFRREEKQEQELLKKELLIASTERSCLERELSRNKQDAKIEIEQMKSFFSTHIEERESFVEDLVHDGMAEVKVLFQRLEALKEENVGLRFYYEQLQSKNAAVSRENALLRQRVNNLSQLNGELSREISLLAQEHNSDPENLSEIIRIVFEDKSIALLA